MTLAATLRTGDWLACCDGGRLVVFENTGSIETPELTFRFERRNGQPPARDLGTDRPGRLHAPGGGPTSAVGQTDFHAAAEERFVAEVAGILAEAAEDGSMPGVVVAAPPKVLGTLRNFYGDRLSGMIRGEIVADLVHEPVRELTARFRAA